MHIVMNNGIFDKTKIILFVYRPEKVIIFINKIQLSVAHHAK
jgi:hypothetical protein